VSSIAKAPPQALFELVVDQWTEPFWQAAAAHRLVVPRCHQCDAYRMPPTPFCPACRSQEIDWIEMSSEAELYSYTVVTRAILPGTESSIPYVPAIISLPGTGVRLVSNVVDVAIEDLHVGMPLTLVWHDLAPGLSIPRYRAAD
jgi:uncharacterized OB-fold protein